MRQAFFFSAKSAAMVKIFFFVLFSAVLVEGNKDGYSDFDVLKNLTDSGKRNVLETFDKIEVTSGEFDKFFKERFDCLMWECTVQQQNLNKSITEAVAKGMLKDKRFSNFQCISDAARDTLKKLDELKTQTSVNSQRVHDKVLREVTQFRVTFVGFFNYTEELYNKKKKELEKAGNDDARKRILEETLKKIKLLASILEQILSNAKTAKFKFIEEYINFAFSTETNFKRIQKEGAKKMMKCVS